MPLPSQTFRSVGQGAKAFCHILIGAILLLTLYTEAGASQQGMTLANPWLRMTLPSRPAAGYFRLSNDNAQARLLIGASSSACGSIMLHRSTNSGGIEGMNSVASVPIPAHGFITFAPGGYHLMCLPPLRDVKIDGSVPIVLHFVDGTTLSAKFLVRGTSAR